MESERDFSFIQLQSTSCQQRMKWLFSRRERVGQFHHDFVHYKIRPISSLTRSVKRCEGIGEIVVHDHVAADRDEKRV